MKTALLVICLSLCVGAVFAAPVQWAASTGGNGHWYEAVCVPGGVNWTTSNTAAIASGGYLATITSSAENIFITALISDDPDFWYYEGSNGIWSGPWFGGYQDVSAPDYSEPGGGWRWVTGEHWDYANWAQGEPNNATGLWQQDRTHFIVWNDDFRSGTWDDSGDSPTIAGGYCMYNGYVIEYNAVPEPSSILALLTSVSGLGGIMWRRRR